MKRIVVQPAIATKKSPFLLNLLTRNAMLLNLKAQGNFIKKYVVNIIMTTGPLVGVFVGFRMNENMSQH